MLRAVYLRGATYAMMLCCAALPYALSMMRNIRRCYALFFIITRHIFRFTAAAAY